jgi:hypothetical protein
MALSINITSQSVEYSTGGSIPTTQNLTLSISTSEYNYNSYKLYYFINNGCLFVSFFVFLEHFFLFGVLLMYDLF